VRSSSGRVETIEINIAQRTTRRNIGETSFRFFCTRFLGNRQTRRTHTAPNYRQKVSIIYTCRRRRRRRYLLIFNIKSTRRNFVLNISLYVSHRLFTNERRVCRNTTSVSTHDRNGIHLHTYIVCMCVYSVKEGPKT